MLQIESLGSLHGLKVLVTQMSVHTCFFNFPVPLCRPFNYLCKTPELVTLLQDLSSGYDISPLLRYLLPHLVCTVVQSDTGKLAYIFTILLSLMDT